MPAGPVYSIAEIFEDPQYAHRETIVTAGLAHRPAGRSRHRCRRSRTPPAAIRWLGPALGADTDDVLAELLHRTAEEIAELRADGVI